MASVRRRDTADGSGWQVRYYDPNGRLLSKTFKRKIDAYHFARAVETDKARGDWLDPRLSRVTFGQYVEEWRPTIANLKPKTRAGYESLLRAHILPEFRDVPLGKITTARCRAFLNSLATHDDPERPLSSARAGRVHHLLKMILKSAVEAGYLAKNPCVGIRLRRGEKREARPLTVAEVDRLAAEAHPEDATLVYLLAYGGLRWGEAVALRRGRCNLLKRQVQIKESLSEVGGQLVFGPTKTYEHRTVPLPAFLVDKLARHLEGVPSDPEALVFTSERGQPLRNSNWRNRVWLPALGAAGLEHRRIHDLRHTCASLLIEQGHSPKSIQEHLGHSSITVTLDIYGHLYPEEREKIAAGLESAYRGAQRP